MKTLPAILLLLAACALGAFTHHLTESGAAEAGPGKRTVPAARVTGGVARDAALAEVAKTLQETADGPDDGRTDWIRLDEVLSTLKAADFHPLATELARHSNGKLHVHSAPCSSLLEYWAAADAAGLLRCAEAGEFGLTLEMGIGRCMVHAPELVVAAIRRRQAVGEDAEKIWQLWAWGALPPLALHSPEKAWKLAAENGVLSEKTVSVLDTALLKWVMRDAAAAVNFARQHRELLPAVLSAWVATAPDAAFAWSDAHPGECEDGNWVEAGLAGFAREHPLEAERFLSRLDTPHDVIGRQAEGLVRSDPVSAAAWLNKLSDDARENALPGALDYLMNSRQPARAAEFCARLTKPPDADKIFRIFGDWSLQDPAAAMAMLHSNRLPENATELCLPMVMDRWLTYDRRAAEAFIAQQPSSEASGMMQLQASNLLEDGNAESARDFALNLGSPAERLGACRQILRRWFPDDPGRNEAARQWLAEITDSAIRSQLDSELVRSPSPE
jgi:hypothetical protein